MLTMRDAIIERCLEGIANGDFDLSDISDLPALFDKFRVYRAQLDAAHPLKHVKLPDEGSPTP